MPQGGSTIVQKVHLTGMLISTVLDSKDRLVLLSVSVRITEVPIQHTAFNEQIQSPSGSPGVQVFQLHLPLPLQFDCGLFLTAALLLQLLVSL